jgi:ATP-dependent Clp protease protease subunit
MQYTINADSDEPIMLLNKHIGFDDEDGQGIDGALFQQELLALDQMGKKRIQVWINSSGGNVVDGYNIVNAIMKSKTPVDTYCQGMAASMAGIIFQAGRKRIMADYGILMYHNPYAGETTDSPVLDAMKNSLNKIICERSGMTTDAVQRMMDRTSFIEAGEAKGMNLCDTVESSVSLNTKYFPKEVKAFMKEANKILNKLIPTPMVKVTARLKLNQDANEESIVTAIDEAVNKAKEDATAAANKVANVEIEKLKNDLKEAQNTFKVEKEAKEKAEKDLKEAQDKLQEAADKALEIEATSFVETAVNEGKVKNDAAEIKKVIAQYKANPKATKEVFEAVPVNKQSSKFVIKNKETEAPTWNAAAEMQKISNKLDAQK